MGDERDTAQVHPYQFTTSMADLAKDKGAKIVYGRCTGIDSKTDVKKVLYTDKETGEEKSARSNRRGRDCWSMDERCPKRSANR